MPSALGDIRVVEIAEGWAGPLCGKLLAELGAEVIKVEPPQGDRVRRLGPFKNGVSYAFELTSAGKESVVLDLGDREGQRSLRELLRSADVLISDRPRDMLVSLGWDQEQFNAAFPRLVHCSITPFGRTGPLTDWAGNELVAQAMSAAMYRTGYPEDPPTRIGVGLAEHAAAGFALIGTLAALNWRACSGSGQSVDVALLDCMVYYLNNQLPEFFANGEVPYKLANSSINGAPWDSYPAKDGHVLICTTFDRQFHSLCRLIGREELIDDPRYKTTPDRHDRRQELDAIISEWTGARTITEVVEAVEAVRIPTGPFVTIERLMHDEQFLARGMLLEHDHPVAGRMPTSGPVFKMSETPGVVRGRAPLLGEHTQKILLAPALPMVAISGQDPPIREGERPLDGLRVIEVGDATTGPFCARILANLGAEVIKVEPPGGVRTRVHRPQIDGMPYSFHIASNDKKSVTLNTSTDRGREIFFQLIRQSDIFLENLGPGTVAEMGFSYEALAQANPRLIYASIKGYGMTGPYGHKGAYDAVIQAVAGVSNLTGWPHRDPVRAGVSTADLMGGTFTPAAILAALYHRQKTSQGQLIDISMHDLAGWATQQAWPLYFASGQSPARIGNRHHLFAPNNAYQARDGLVVIAVETDEQWQSLARAIGREDLLRDERYQTSEKRQAAVDELDALVAAWVGKLTVPEVVERCQQNRVPAGPVLDMPEALSHPQVQARQMIVEVPTDPSGPRVKVTAPPHKLSRTPARVKRGAASLGQHNNEVYHQLLGLSSQEVEELRQQHII